MLAPAASGFGRDVSTLLRLLLRPGGSLAAVLVAFALALHVFFQFEFAREKAAEAQARFVEETARQLHEVTARAVGLTKDVEALRLANQDIRYCLRDLIDELARLKSEIDRLASDRAADNEASRHTREQVHVLGGNLAVLRQKMIAAAIRVDDSNRKADRALDLANVRPEPSKDSPAPSSEAPPPPPRSPGLNKDNYMIKRDPKAPRHHEDEITGGYVR